MATVGQSLKTPETGWTRYDDNNVNFGYVGTGWKIASVSPSYGYINNQYHFTTGVINDSISFNFVGTKIRIIGEMQAGCSGNISISIDGVSETFSAVNSSKVYVALLYEKNNLDNKEHRVVITNNTTSTLIFDAIDIDESGELKPYSPISTVNNPTHLTADSGDDQVTLNWDAVTGAISYNVKRSLTTGGPYETIASNVFGTSYVDNDVVNGTTYYYVVTAVNSDGESANSNEASATPQAVENPPSGKALLRVTMIDSSEREYRLDKTEIDGFVNWYTRTIGTGISCYSVNDIVDGSKEYLAFEKIISFKVIPLPAE